MLLLTASHEIAASLVPLCPFGARSCCIRVKYVDRSEHCMRRSGMVCLQQRPKTATASRSLCTCLTTPHCYSQTLWIGRPLSAVPSYSTAGSFATLTATDFHWKLRLHSATMHVNYSCTLSHMLHMIKPGPNLSGLGESCIKDCRLLADAVRELVRKEVRWLVC